MAKPEKSRCERRPVRLVLRFSEAEHQKLAQLVEFCGRPLSVLLREKLLTGRLPQPEIPMQDLNTYLELQKIGLDLNRLTRKVNAGMLPAELLEPLLRLGELLKQNISKLIYDRS